MTNSNDPHRTSATSSELCAKLRAAALLASVGLTSLLGFSGNSAAQGASETPWWQEVTVTVASSKDPDDPLPPQRWEVPGDVLFDVGEVTLTPAAQRLLADVAEELVDIGDGSVAVTCHTDSTGDETYNQRLSETRAAQVGAAIRAQLTADGSAPSISVIEMGRGETEPVASNATPSGKALNRRCELVLEDHAEP